MTASDPTDSPTIHVIAPSGPVPEASLRAGMSIVRRSRRATWRVASNVETRAGYFAGPDEARLAGIVEALLDPGAHAVWCARGGYGATRILRPLETAMTARTAPDQGPPPLPPIVGFSDVTALLCWALARHGCRGVHGPVLTSLARVDHEDQARVLDLLDGDVPPPLEVAGPTSCTLHGGVAEGPLIVGNLEVLRSLIGTPDLPDLRGCVLGIEEVGERPYRIDRALTQLREAGALRGVAGVAVGQLHACEEPEGTMSAGATAREVVLERLEGLGVPVVTGFPFGHAPERNAALVFGAPTRLHADHGTLEQLEGVKTSRS